MKYYEENSAAMSEDDDNVELSDDVSVLAIENEIFTTSRDFHKKNFFGSFSRTETISAPTEASGQEATSTFHR